MIEERGYSQSTLMCGLELLEALLSLFSASNTAVWLVIGCAAYETVESLCSKPWSRCARVREYNFNKNLQKFKGSEPEFANFELFPKFGTELRTANLGAELNH